MPSRCCQRRATGRFTTYAIEGERGSGTLCLNGACARLSAVGDLVIVVSYAQKTPEEADRHAPVSVHVDARNRIVDIERGSRRMNEPILA